MSSGDMQAALYSALLASGGISAGLYKPIGGHDCARALSPGDAQFEVSGDSGTTLVVPYDMQVIARPAQAIYKPAFGEIPAYYLHDIHPDESTHVPDGYARLPYEAYSVWWVYASSRRPRRRKCPDTSPRDVDDYVASVVRLLRVDVGRILAGSEDTVTTTDSSTILIGRDHSVLHVVPTICCDQGEKHYKGYLVYAGECRCSQHFKQDVKLALIVSWLPIHAKRQYGFVGPVRNVSLSDSGANSAARRLWKTGQLTPTTTLKRWSKVAEGKPEYGRTLAGTYAPDCRRLFRLVRDKGTSVSRKEIPFSEYTTQVLKFRSHCQCREKRWLRLDGCLVVHAMHLLESGSTAVLADIPLGPHADALKCWLVRGLGGRKEIGWRDEGSADVKACFEDHQDAWGTWHLIQVPWRRSVTLIERGPRATKVAGLDRQAEGARRSLAGER